MYNKKTLKELYHLSYDNSGFKSGLIEWYNKMIDKSYFELSCLDVCKMIRQTILPEVAAHKAIELFLSDPYDGGLYDGELLEELVHCDVRKIIEINSTLKTELAEQITRAKKDYENFEWNTEENKVKFMENLKRLEIQL